VVDFSYLVVVVPLSVDTFRYWTFDKALQCTACVIVVFMELYKRTRKSFVASKSIEEKGMLGCKM
jgi:hypothetical protein